MMNQRMYHSHRITHAGVDALLASRDAFGAFEDFDAVEPMAPCRSTPVTEAMRKADAALLAERERANVSPALEWRAKVQLDEANLRTVKAARLAPGRVAMRKGAVLRAAGGRAMKNCEKGCGRTLEARSAQSICWHCRPTLGNLKPCDRCGVGFNRWSPHATCRPCRTAVREVKHCATEGCERVLKSSNKSGFCWRCKDNARGRETATEHRAVIAGRQMRYRLRKTAEADKRCSMCGVLIKWNAKTGLCGRHAAQAGASITRLRAASREELDANRQWAALDVAAKLRVLAVMEANLSTVYISQEGTR